MFAEHGHGFIRVLVGTVLLGFNLLLTVPVSFAEPEQLSSFSEEYMRLAELLASVHDGDSARANYEEIVSEIQWLRSRQTSGEEVFQQLSPQQKELFIRRFQNNQFYCGVITQVHQEARRIMLNDEIRPVIGDWIEQIP